MSRLIKLARIYKAVSYLEKRAFSLAGVQKAVGATAGRATQAEAKAMARAGLSHEAQQAQKAIQSSGDMFGGYGMPLVAGAGLLGAGYLYANSGNSQQPTPYQGGA